MSEEFLAVGDVISANEFDDAAGWFVGYVDRVTYERIKRTQEDIGLPVVEDRPVKVCFLDCGCEVFKSVPVFDGEPDWVPEGLEKELPELREDEPPADNWASVECQELHVSERYVWWEMCPEYGSGHYETCMIPIEALDAFFKEG